MRLLYVSRSAGGHDQRFLTAWARAGVDVSNITVDADPHDVRTEVELRDVIENFRPDLVQVGPLTDPGFAVSRVWSGPLIATSWGFDLMDEVDRDTAVLGRARTVLEAASLVFVDNDASSRRAISLGALQEQIVQFPWGVDSEWFHQRESRPFSDAMAVTFLSTRRHEPIYRVGDVIEAFISVAAKHLNARLCLVGVGSLTSKFEAIIDAAGLADRVQFRGEVSNQLLPEIYRAADAYITASSVDGSSVSLLEAMASGTPVVASRIEGNAQWVSEDTGLSFDVGDVSQLSAHLGKLASMGPEAVRLASERAAKANALVQARAKWAQTVERFPEYSRMAIENWQGTERSTRVK